MLSDSESESESEASFQLPDNSDQFETTETESVFPTPSPNATRTQLRAISPTSGKTSSLGVLYEISSAEISDLQNQLAIEQIEVLNDANSLGLSRDPDFSGFCPFFIVKIIC